MKIAVVCPDDLSVVLFCNGLINRLMNRGRNEVIVLSDPDISGENVDGYFSDVIGSWGVARREVPFSRFFNPVADLKYLYSLYRVFRDECVGMVVNISTKPNIYGPLAARCAGISNIVCSVWGMGVVFSEQQDLGNRVLRNLVKMLYHLSFAASRKVWFTNGNDAEYFLEHGLLNPEKLVRTKNYVNTDDYTPNCVTEDEIVSLRKKLGLDESNRVVVMVARMSWAKGVREFAEAASLMRDTHPHVRFLLVGPMDNGSSDSVPEEYLEKQQENDNFMWLGFQKDVKILYALSDVAVLPTYYREGGYPRGLTEPMSMGKPIVTTESVHCRGTIENAKNGYIVPIKDSASLADAIRKLVDDDELRRRFGEYSRIKAESEFSEDVIIDELMRKIF